MLITFIRTVIFYFVTMIAIRIMGKRQIGQLEPAELVVTIMISELATMPIQDLDAPLINTLVSIFTLVSFEILISVISMKSKLMRRSVSGNYSVIIDEGKINVSEMKKVQLTVDELMEELRQNGVISPKDVRYCILETCGKMSVFSKNEAQANSFPLVLISDGKIVKKNLAVLDMSKRELLDILSEKYELSIKDIFILLYADGNLTLVKNGGEICDY